MPFDPRVRENCEAAQMMAADPSGFLGRRIQEKNQVPLRV